MSTERDRDLLERLRVLNPVVAGQFDDLVFTEPAHALFRQIVATDAPVGLQVGGRRVLRPLPAGGQHRRSGRRVAVVAGLVSLSVAVAGYALVGRQPSKPQTVACFAAAELQSLTAVVAVESDGPVAACSRVWEQGFFRKPAPSPLRACVLESDVVGVFPEASGSDVCLHLGLASVSRAPSPPESGPFVDPGRFAAFRDAVAGRLDGQGCVGVKPATSIVGEELERAGLTGWKVVLGGGADGAWFSADRPCVSLSYQPEARTVELVPLPPPG